MADGHFPTLVSKDRNANVAGNPIFVQLSDGTNVLNTTGGSLDVNITGGSSAGTEFAEDAAHTNGDLGTVALVVRKDTIASNVGADGDYATLLQDANGRLYVQIHDGGNSITVDATDLDIRDLTATDVVTVVQAAHDNLNLNANIQMCLRATPFRFLGQRRPTAKRIPSMCRWLTLACCRMKFTAMTPALPWLLILLTITITPWREQPSC